MKFAIAGCGLIGQKRLKTILKGHTLVAAADPVAGRAERLVAQAPGAQAFLDWKALVDLPGVDALVIATVNEWLAPVTLAALQAGKHVLVEKPGLATRRSSLH